MSLLDISQVTRTLIAVIKSHIEDSPVWSAGSTLSVVPDPPDSLTGDNTLGLYLYHIVEDANLKNALPQGNGQPPIQYTPMPLTLYYQLSAHSDLQSPTGSFQEQLLLGAAMKALHDFPVIGDDTLVRGVQVMPLVIRGQDNRIKLELRPVAAEDAVSFWTAGSTPLRLAAYYEVSVVLLEPEPISSGVGPVLTYNTFAFPQQTPWISTTRNELVFTVPGETVARTLPLQPARVPFSGQFSITGTSFLGGQTDLLLHQADWDEPVAVDPLAWSLQLTNEELSAQVQTELNGTILLPGVYSAFVRVMKRRTGSDGLEREFTQLSNASPFVISPRIDAVTAVSAAGEFTVTGHVFQHAGIAADDVLIFVGDGVLSVGTAGSLNAGEYAVTSPTQVSIRLPAGLPPGEPVYLRIQIRGADTGPLWVTAP